MRVTSAPCTASSFIAASAVRPLKAPVRLDPAKTRILGTDIAGLPCCDAMPAGYRDAACRSIVPAPERNRLKPRAVALQPVAAFRRSGAQLAAELPEGRAVVHLAKMGDLMGREIVDHRRRCH